MTDLVLKLRDTDLILSVDPCLDLASLYETDNLPLQLFHRPPESDAHTFELDGCERLEVKDKRPAPDEVRDVRHVRGKVNVDEMARLKHTTIKACVVDSYLKTKNAQTHRILI